MSQITEELKKEHTFITSALKKAKDLGVNTKNGADAFLIIKDMLLDHLRKCDERVYPALRNAAKTNNELQFTMELNARAPEQVTKLAEEFFRKYREGQADMQFVMDFGKLSALLGQRIRNEANFLFPEFDKLNGKA